MTGRPSSYTDEIADLICERIAEGESLRSICGSEGMPAKKTVLRWLSDRESFRAQYARAREDQADHYAEEIVAIADAAEGDFVETENGPAFNAEHVQRSKLRVDARKWVASKLKPKKYGDRLDVESKGSLTITIAKGDDGFL